MKKVLFTTVILLTAAVQVFAQSKRAILKIRLSDQSPLTVTIDNRVYEKHGLSITIGDLPAGSHFVKVYEYKAYRDSRGGNAKLLYSGNIRTRRNTITTCVVDPYEGSARIKSRVMEYEEEWNDRRDEERNDNDHYNNSSNDDRNTLSQRDMDDLKKRVDDRITDTDKLKLMKSVLGNTGYYTDQVQKMMGWLTFEGSKLDFAKWGYKNVVDAKNYWKLESEFSFSSSKDEFNDYIQGKN